MAETLREHLVATTTPLSRACWVFGSAVMLIALGLCLLINIGSVEECDAVALLKLRFVGTNSIPLSPEEYADKDYGWDPMFTEKVWAQSEVVVSRALQRLHQTQPVAAAYRRVRVELVRGGLRIHASGKHAVEAAAFADALAQAYREERMHLGPAPPGCRELSITIAEKATPVGMPPFFRNMCRGALGALLVGLAGTLWFAGETGSVRRSAVPMFLFWLCSVSGIGVLLTGLTLALAFTAALTLAILAPAIAACTAFIREKEAPVSSKLFTVARAIVCITIIGSGAIFELSPWEGWNSAQVKVSVVEAGAQNELLLGYDPCFLATECELIPSRAVLGQQVEAKPATASVWSRDRFLGPRETEELLSRRTRARAVPNTSIIEVRYWGSNGEQGGAKPGVSEVISKYQNYWTERSKTNLSRKISVTALGSAESSRRQTRSHEVERWSTMTSTFVGTIFVLGGIFAAAMVASRPWRLWVFPAFGILYVCALVFGLLLSSLTPEVHDATCLVRVWPPADRSDYLDRPTKESAGDLLRKERKIAGSDAVISNALAVLKESPQFRKGQGGGSSRMDSSETGLWLKRHLKVFAVGGTFLLGFRVEAPDSHDAIEAANAAATAYCELRRATGAPPAPGLPKPEVEIMAKAVPAVWPEPASNPLAEGLENGLSCILLFLVGAGIGYFGFLAEKGRRGRRAAFTAARSITVPPS